MPRGEWKRGPRTGWIELPAWGEHCLPQLRTPSLAIPN